MTSIDKGGGEKGLTPSDKGEEREIGKAIGYEFGAIRHES